MTSQWFGPGHFLTLSEYVKCDLNKQHVRQFKLVSPTRVQHQTDALPSLHQNTVCGGRSLLLCLHQHELTEGLLTTAGCVCVAYLHLADWGLFPVKVNHRCLSLTLRQKNQLQDKFLTSVSHSCCLLVYSTHTSTQNVRKTENRISICTHVAMSMSMISHRTDCVMRITWV